MISDNFITIKIKKQKNYLDFGNLQFVQGHISKIDYRMKRLKLIRERMISSKRLRINKRKDLKSWRSKNRPRIKRKEERTLRKLIKNPKRSRGNKLSVKRKY